MTVPARFVHSVDEILAIPDPHRFSVAIQDRVFRGGGERSVAEETVYCIAGVEAQVNNGGFWQFYYNYTGADALETERALRRIRANRMADLVERTNALFGLEGPAADQDERRGQVEALSSGAGDE